MTSLHPDLTGPQLHKNRHNGCKVYNDGTQSIPNNSSTAVTFGAEEWDTDGLHSTASDTSRITIPTGLDGLWAFTYHIMLHGGSATGLRIAFLRKNGGTDANNVIGSESRLVPSTATHIGLNNTVEVSLVATDYIELFVYQNSGGAVNIGETLAAARASVSTLSATFRG